MLERIEVFVDFRVDCLIAVADGIGVNVPEAIEVVVCIGMLIIFVLGARNHQRLLIKVEDAREQEFLIRENNFGCCHGYAFTRDSYISGRRSRKNCQVLRTSAMRSRSRSAVRTSSLSREAWAMIWPRGSQK